MTAWLKLALAGAIAAAVGAIAATIWIGARVREDTVVANPYEEGLRLNACDLNAGPCTRPLEGGGEVTLELMPRPLRTMRELTVRVLVDWRLPERIDPRLTTASEAEIVTRSVSFSMPGMEMGENRVALETMPPDRSDWVEGKAVLVRCPSGKRDWIAEVAIAVGRAPPRTARFPFRVEQ